jgi:succinoglycan biosynthesis protein ExoA
MPIRNEEKHIAQTLRQVLDQRRDGLDVEIIVVDGRSTDRTREIVQSICERHPEVVLHDNPKRLSSAARNIAINHSTGKYVVVIDGHCEIPTRTYFVDLVKAFESGGSDCLGRPQPLDVSNASPLQRAVAVARASRLGHHPDSYVYSQGRSVVPALSVATAYRRSVFDKVGLFDERFDACEDCELNHRVDQAGLVCALDLRLAVKYQPRNSLSGLFRQLARYGRGRVRLVRKHPEIFSWKTFLPAALVAGLFAGPLVCFFFPLLWPLFLTVVVAYLVVVLAVSVTEAWRHRQPKLLFWLPLVFFTIHFGAGAGVLMESLSRSWAESERPSPQPHVLSEAAR